MGLFGISEIIPAFSSLKAVPRLFSERPVEGALITVAATLVFWMSWAPPHQYDALVYHLPLAQSYARAHGFSGAGAIAIYRHFPQNAELLFAMALLLKSDILAQLLMWTAFILTLGWVIEEGRRRLDSAGAFLGALLLCTQTSVMLLSATTYVEALVMLWTTAAVFSFLREDRRWLILSAIFTGLALGTKYCAGLTAALLFAGLIIRSKRKSVWADAAIFVGVVSAVFAPWLIKNYLMSGNPVFPFLNGVFSGPENVYAKGYFATLTAYRLDASYWTKPWALAIQLLTGSLRFGGGMDSFGALGWGLLFWCLPLSAWAAWKNPARRALALFCASYLACWCLTGVLLRFLTAVAPLLCLLAADGLYALRAKVGSWTGRALAGAVLIFCAVNIALFLFIDAGIFGQMSYLLGVENRDQYLSRRLDYYPCARFAQENIPLDRKILIAGDQRGYYVAQDNTAMTIYGPNRLIDWANASESPRDLAARLSSQGYSTILRAQREYERIGPSFGLLTPEGRKNWDGLEPQFSQLLYRAPGCSLYGLKVL
jgi:hypothetical protein